MEHNYKNRLQERSISPSKDSWDKLDQRLTAYEQKKKRGTWFFLKYAAAILLIFSAGFYFNQTKEEKIETIIVEQPIKKEQKNKLEKIIEEPENVLAETENKNLIIEPKQDRIAIQNSKVSKDIVIAANDKIAKKDHFIKRHILIEEDEVQISEMDVLKKQKVKELVARVEMIKKTKGEVSDVEIKNLLNEAYESLAIEKKLLKNQLINGDDLLAEIEFDLMMGTDFKEKLFEAIVKTLKDPKKVFVNRDN